MKVKPVFILAVLLIIFGTFSREIISFGAYNAAKQMLAQGKYDQAYNFLKFATEKNSTSKEYSSLYTQALLKATKSAEVQGELYKIAVAQTDSTSSNLAKREIHLLKADLTKGIGPHYIENAPYNDLILHWDTDRMPIKVFFGTLDSVPIPQQYFSSIQKALNTWIANLDVPISYRIINDYNKADLKIVFVPKISEALQSNGETHISYGVTSPQIQNNKLISMEIKLRTLRSDSQQFTNIEIYNTALHELGHALGVMGHSFNKNDVMYPLTNDIEAGDLPYTYKIRRLKLSQKDINTMRLLYRLAPDITNGKTNTGKLFNSTLVLGDKQSRLTRKLAEAEKYVYSVSDNPTGWIDAGVAYGLAGKYEQSINAFNRALAQVASSQEKADIYYNIAIISYNNKKYSECISNSQQALTLNPNMLAAKELIAASHSKQGLLTQAKMEYMYLTAADPANVDFAYSLATLYIRSYEFPSAGRILNRLFAANPQAKEDPKVQNIAFLAAIFK